MTPSLDTAWLTVGFAGQAAFALRFLVQWLSSERAGRSVIPLAFWYLSIGGAALLLAYALYRRDPVFIAGQVTGVLIYVRNLQLIRRAQAPVRTQHAPALGSSDMQPSTRSRDG